MSEINASEFFVALCRADKWCAEKITEKGHVWVCKLPKGHDGEHARVDLDVHFFRDRPTGRMSFSSAQPVGQMELKPCAPCGAKHEERR